MRLLLQMLGFSGSALSEVGFVLPITSTRWIQKMADIQEILYHFEDSLFLQSRLELEAYAHRHLSIATGWGYFPEMPENDPKNYPNTHLLAKKIEQIVIGDASSKESPFKLSFIKHVSGEVKNCYGGLHLDTDASLQENEEIERILINLHTHPRKIKFAALDRHQLTKQGIYYSRHQYTLLELTHNVETSIVEIPERTSNRLYFIKFLASLIPHVGLTQHEGHFLASFERKIKIERN